jgi:predicted transcriptional regulator
MKNRSRMEILYDIISSSKSPARKTNLMYKSNLSFKQLELYLGFLVEQGLIEVRPEEGGSGRMYGATSRGFQFTKLFEDLQSYLTLSNPLRAMSLPDAELREKSRVEYSAPEIEIP